MSCRSLSEHGTRSIGRRVVSSRFYTDFMPATQLTLVYEKILGQTLEFSTEILGVISAWVNVQSTCLPPDANCPTTETF